MGFWDETKKSVFQFSTQFSGKTENYMKVAKLKMEIKQKESECKKIQTKLGKKILEYLNSEEKFNQKSEFIVQISEEIIKVQESIKKKELEIEKLQNKESNFTEEKESENANTDEEKTESPH